MFISWKLAELMKSGRSIVQRSPFISWEVYVSLRIFACMLSTPTESSVEFMVAELDDALQSLMFRWNICYERYSAFRLSDNEKKKIGSIIQSGIDFLQKKKEVPL